MSKSTLIFVHGGSFFEGHSGLAKRTRLCFDVLTHETAYTARYVVGPKESEIVEAKLAALGWLRITTPVHLELKRKPLGAIRLYLWRWWLTFYSRINDKLAESMLSMFGGADMIITKELVGLLQSTSGATVWLSRCDLLPLVRYCRPDQKVILDANDSVANLVQRYNYRSKVRLLAGYSKKSFHKVIKRTELRLARRCSIIIAISSEDYDYYSECLSPSLHLEETCVVLDPDIIQVEKKYDVGYMGGSHDGSLAAARNFATFSVDPRMRHLRFAVAGTVCERLKAEACGRLELLGRVPDAMAFVRSCRYILLWSEGETGTSVKFQEAVLSGAVVIANREAARWTKAQANIDYLVCEDKALVPDILLKVNDPPASKLRDFCTFRAFSIRLLTLAGIDSK